MQAGYSIGRVLIAIRKEAMCDSMRVPRLCYRPRSIIRNATGSVPALPGKSAKVTKKNVRFEVYFRKTPWFAFAIGHKSVIVPQLDHHFVVCAQRREMKKYCVVDFCLKKRKSGGKLVSCGVSI